jgi:hypothetical protein
MRLFGPISALRGCCRESFLEVAISGLLTANSDFSYGPSFCKHGTQNQASITRVQDGYLSLELYVSFLFSL